MLYQAFRLKLEVSSRNEPQTANDILSATFLRVSYAKGDIYNYQRANETSKRL